jgi:energy-converting hydrogenase B subunit D
VVPLQAIAIAIAIVGATGVVLARDPLRQIVVSGFYGLALTALFTILQAPDVALSMLVVSAVAYPLIVLAAISRVRNFDPSEEEGRGE